MTAAWRQLPVLILLILAPCRTVSSKSVDPTTQPLVSIASQPTDTRSVVLQESVDQTTQTLVSIGPQPTDTRTFVLKGDTTFKNVELLNPVNLSLECVWTGSQNKQPSITGYWRKDGAEVQDSRVTVNLKEQQYNLTKVFSIASEENLGNYTCVFGNEFEMYFILGAPQMGEIRDKPIVSYVGDLVVLICKMDEKKPKPNTWTWYKFNGTDREEISAATDPHRYLTINDGWKTKLKVKNVSEADSGLYHCGAVYNISTSMTHVELKVITIMEPLKPFISILIEVIILVAAILIYERSRSKKKEAEANGPNAEPKNAQPQTEDNGGEESSSVRQRKA